MFNVRFVAQGCRRSTLLDAFAGSFVDGEKTDSAGV